MSFPRTLIFMCDTFVVDVGRICLTWLGQFGQCQIQTPSHQPPSSTIPFIDPTIIPNLATRTI